MAAFIDPPRLPIIDFAPFESGGHFRGHVAAQIDWAASEFGFFYIVGHRVDLSAIERLIGLSRTFFQQPPEAKAQLHMSRGGRAWRGYFPVGGELTSGRPDLKEGLYFGEELADADARVRAGIPLHGANLFPDLPGFRDAVLDYMTELTGLGHHLMSAIARGLHLNDHYFFDRFTGNPTRLFRIFNYPAGGKGAGVGEHTDYGLLTLLYQDEVGGLQVKHRDTWIDVPYVPGSFVINIGDMMQYWTNDRWISTIHRVVNPPRDKNVGSRRQSIVFFHSPNEHTLISCLDGCSSAANPPKYPPILAGEHLRQKSEKAGTLAEAKAR